MLSGAVALPAGLALVHRQDCELCDLMLAGLQEMGRRLPLPPLSILDVDRDPLLLRRFGVHVPVLLLDGLVVCRHRLEVPELERLLRGRP